MIMPIYTHFRWNSEEIPKSGYFYKNGCLEKRKSLVDGVKNKEGVLEQLYPVLILNLDSTLMDQSDSIFRLEITLL